MRGVNQCYCDDCSGSYCRPCDQHYDRTAQALPKPHSNKSVSLILTGSFDKLNKENAILKAGEEQFLRQAEKKLIENENCIQ